MSRGLASPPTTGVILGSGLGSAADHLLLNGGTAISYADIPGMPRTHVAGHAGRLVFGTVGQQSVVMLQGRVHFYEGHDTNAILFGVRLLAQLGIHSLIVTNAAGGIRSSLKPGCLMLIRSHLRPLGTRFPHSGQAAGNARDFATAESEQKLWSPALCDLAKTISTPLSVQDGVYAMMTGPCYETPAEIRMLRTLGADAVGMSTVPEAIEASSSGIRVLGVSCITNVAAGLSDKSLNHAEVTETASSIETEFVLWLWNLLQSMPTPTE